MSKIKIFLLLLIGISLPLYVFWEILFSVDGSYSSVGDPLSGIKITQQKIAGRDLVVLPEEGRALFDLVDLKIKINKEEEIPDSFRIKAYHNYLVSFYDIQEDEIDAEELRELVYANNSTDLAIGTLFVNGTAVSIVLANNSYSSIFNAQLFEKMNYSWDDLVEKEVGFASSLEEKKVFRYGQPHPDGTFIENGDLKYLVWQERLIPISGEVNIREISQAPIIKMPNLLVENFDICESEIKKERIKCNFKKEIDLDKSNYVFEIEEVADLNFIQEIAVDLRTTINQETIKKNFSVSASDIKAKLIKKYGEYLPFI
jgi:hypothetical protein